MLKITETPIKCGARVIKMLVENEFEKKILSMGIKKGSIISIKSSENIIFVVFLTVYYKY